MSIAYIVILFFLLSVPKVRPVGYDGNNPTSVAEWLESLELGDYTKSFLINGYTSMELVKKIWEIELINVSHINITTCYKNVYFEVCMFLTANNSQSIITNLHCETLCRLF